MSVRFLMIFSAFAFLGYPSSADEHAETITVSGVIEDRHGLTLLCNLDIGELETGSKYRITGQIFNATSDAIHAGAIRPSCDRITPLADTCRIEPGEIFDFNFDLETPPNSAVHEHSDRLNFVAEEPGNTKRFNVIIHYRLRGILSFLRPRELLEIKASQESASIEVPFVYSEPIDPSRLQISATGNMEEMEWRIVRLDSGYALRSDLTGVNMNGRVYDGLLNLESLDPKKHASVHLLVRSTPSIAVSPSVVSFRKDSSDARMLVGRVIVRVQSELPSQKTTDNVGQGSSKNAKSVIDCSMNGKPIDCQSKHLGAGTYKTTIRLREDAVPPLGSGLMVDISIRNVEEAVTINCPFRVLSSAEVP